MCRRAKSTLIKDGEQIKIERTYRSIFIMQPIAPCTYVIYMCSDRLESSSEVNAVDAETAKE